MLIGIIGAMELEVLALEKLMNGAKKEIISSVEFYSGVINGVNTVVAAAGVGKVNAAVCTQSMILRYSPDIIVNIGVAGGLSKSLSIGDIAVADAVVEHDMDTSPIGDPKGFVSGINMIKMKCDKKITETLICAVKKMGNMNFERGIIASGDQFISNDTQRNEIISEFGAIAAEMEGASIGHVCVMNNVPFGEIRAISDGANDDSVIDYPTFAKTAAENSINIILEFLGEYISAV